MQLPGIFNDPWMAFAIVVVCLIFSAFFSASETALTAASRASMNALNNQGNAKAGLVMRLLQTRERLIGSILIGNNIVNIGASAFMTSVLVEVFGSGGVLYATILMSALVIIFAEVLPKSVAISNPDRFALGAAKPISFFVSFFGPLTYAVNAIVRLSLKPFGVYIGENQAVLSAHEEILSTVDILHREGSVERSDRDMLGGLLVLKELIVSDVMVHRTKMHMIDIDLPAPEIVKEVLSSPYTRVPLWRGEPENIVGVLHSKDLLRALHAVVPDTTARQEQLQAFLKRKTHFAMVVDEYGEVMGLITLEDIIEEIVGDINDEHDVSIPGLRQNSDGSITVDGAVPIRDLNRAMDWELPDEEATTIAGLVIHEAMTIPDVGQVFTFHTCRFEVLRKNRNRLTSLRVMNVGAKFHTREEDG
jgi:Mg2+/Co2+ transporter CorB